MEWRDSGIVLTARRHGESAAVVTLLTRGHGRHAGLVRGGAGRRLRGVLQPGNQVAATWRGRLSEHLGAFTVELANSRAAGLLDDPLRLAALNAALSLIERAVPEREPHSALYEGLVVLLDALAADMIWQPVYVRWELGLLGELGFGLDLSRCAASGAVDDLAYVSPRSGRAVSASAGAPYRDRLLALPRFLIGARGRAAANDLQVDVRDGLALTGFFLERRLFPADRGGLPAARTRFVERLRRQSTISSGINEP